MDAKLYRVCQSVCRYLCSFSCLGIKQARVTGSSRDGQVSRANYESQVSILMATAHVSAWSSVLRKEIITTEVLTSHLWLLYRNLYKLACSELECGKWEERL